MICHRRIYFSNKIHILYTTLGAIDQSGFVLEEFRFIIVYKTALFFNYAFLLIYKKVFLAYAFLLISMRDQKYAIEAGQIHRSMVLGKG